MAIVLLPALLAFEACRQDRGSHTQAPTRYTAVERARTSPAADLTRVYSIDLDSRGNLYVADAAAIRIFSPEGTLLRSVGRKGKGPGEFDQLSSVQLLTGDSLLAFDASLGRMTVFPPGSQRAAYTLQVGRDQLFFPYRVQRERDGQSITAVFQAAYGDFDGRGEAGRRQEVVRLLNADGSLRKDSVLVLPEQEALPLHGEAEGVLFNPFGRGPALAFTSRGRIVAAWSDSLRFDIYSPEGKLLKTVRPDYVPPRRPITAAERDSVIADLTSSLSPGPAVRRAVERYGARTWPLFRDMIVDDRDRIWVGITGGRGEPHHWTAFDQDGTRAATVDLPANMLLRMVRGTTAYAVALDENDVPQVITFDLEPTPSTTPDRR